MSFVSRSPLTPGSRIAWIGLGSMGLPMAARLSRAGYSLTGYNRTRRESHFSLPFQVFATPSDTIGNADLIIVMLRDGPATREVLTGEKGMLSALKSGQILINMSTESPEEARQESVWCQDRGVLYFDIPVSGSVVPAERGELLLLAGGDETFRSLIAGPMGVLGKSLRWFGSAGSGMAAKLAVNFLLAAHMQSLSETFLVGDALGLERNTLADALLESPLATPFYRIKINNLLNQDYRKAFSAGLMKKDLDLLLSELLKGSQAIPGTLSQARSLYHRIVTKGQGESDLSVIHDLLKKDAEGS
ncbi:MAG: NAD(P)-dependent oxidoreductase [Nitrospirae bacterium]|nr:NAD(P)-dependent oxidoreductase [Nitrospirota bacterium]